MIIRNLCMLVLLVLLVSGCGGQAEDSTADSQVAEEAIETDGEGEDTRINSVTLTGHLGCMSCTFNQGSECAPALEDEQGRIIRLVGMKSEESLCAAEPQEEETTLSGVLAQSSGEWVLRITSATR